MKLFNGVAIECPNCDSRNMRHHTGRDGYTCRGCRHRYPNRTIATLAALARDCPIMWTWEIVAVAPR